MTAQAQGSLRAQVLARLQSLYPDLNPAERRVVDHLLQDPQSVIRNAITAVADQCQVSEATVVRVCKKAGLGGFQELKIRLAQDLVTPAQMIHEEVSDGDRPAEIKRKVFQAAAQALADTMDKLDDASLERAVDLVHGARKVAFFGVGVSGWICMDAALKFMRLGLNTAAYNDGPTQAVSAVLLQPGDVAFAISHSGANKEVLSFVTLAKQSGAAVVCLTSHARSPIAKLSDVILLTASRETAFRPEAMTTKLAQIAVIDTLFVSVAHRRFPDATLYLQRTREAMARRLM